MSGNIEFKAWPKIARGNKETVTITEKIDGTNACIIIQGGEIVGVQSRKRLITPEDDNYGFAAWVDANKDEIKLMGDGYVYGEWAGVGIQKNPHNYPDKRFLTFNTFRPIESLPKCVHQVPVLYCGEPFIDMADEAMSDLIISSKNKWHPEGIVIFSHLTKVMLKYTYKFSNGKWSK